ncbi:LRR receptor-like serine threonine-protein kinase [Seminavis robusta]|uniref:LRR receptor-like serine threonine-protein kinase n=1 Tax=Seminavis robusta TaxID=568900 RepID=A0A9N8E837_9STRA|nr:LRR receptor-like serine threonine-protein kinase [Seminavis robusta]|eukprot:Sro787_g202300.1 LRR receptor-like serine threonine-protein kinase (800) ;mRNA; f:7698-10398
MRGSTKNETTKESENSNDEVDLLNIVEMRIRGDASDFEIKEQTVHRPGNSMQACRVPPPRPPQHSQAASIPPPPSVHSTDSKDSFDIFSLVAARAAQPSLPDADNLCDQGQNTLELAGIKDTRAVVGENSSTTLLLLQSDFTFRPTSTASNGSTTSRQGSFATGVPDNITSTEPLPTLTAPSLSRARRVSAVSVSEPGAHAVDGITLLFDRPRSRPSTGGTPDMEELGLELVPTSQNETDGNGGLIHADLVDDSEIGEIPTAEPMTTRAKRLWKKQLCLGFSRQAIVAITIVSILLLAFLLARKSSNQTPSAKQQNGAIPIPEYPGTTASITQAPTSLWERLNLPEYTLRVMENPRSPQTKAYQWLSNNINKSNNTQHLPVWRLKQRFALATFYYSTRGDYWVKNQGWLDWDTNECSWEQLQWLTGEAACADNGKLLSLRFGYANNYANNLDGTIPPEIALLHDSLETLSIFQNPQLKGNIPMEVGLMTRLTLLLFSTTSLSGTLPTELGQLESLEGLSISGRELDGTLPTQLGNLRKLTSLGFSRANFSGSIPTEVLRLSNLKSLSLLECPLLDTASFLPEVVGNLHSLNSVNLGYRKTGGFTSIPSEIGKLTNLASLILKDFQLNGPLPSELAMLTNLNYLDLQRNSITGTLPQELSKMSQLEIVNIGSNQLEGRPLEQGVLHQLTQLQELHINDNLFSGCIATEIGSMSSLEKLELQNTNLSGTLPTELLLLDNLTSLVVMNTSLTGSIPDGLCGAILSPHERKYFGGNSYSVPTTNLSACYGTSLCGCTCDPCPK